MGGIVEEKLGVKVRINVYEVFKFVIKIVIYFCWGYWGVGVELVGLRFVVLLWVFL